MKRQTVCKPPEGRGKLFWVDGFLSPTQCSAVLAELHYAFWQPSGVSYKGSNGTLASVTSPMRVSLSTDEYWFTPSLTRLVRAITQRLTPLVPRIAQRAEVWQATRYAAGGKFDYHHDAGHWREQRGGERAFTVLIYLDTPRRGGGTRFKELKLEVKAQAGRLVVWRNLDRNGQCDRSMRHASTPLAGGRKTVLVTWVRQRRCR